MKDETSTQQMQSTPAVLVKLLQGEANKSEVRFMDSFTIGGSKECHLHINDDRVSRNHTNLHYDGQRWFVIDVESTNGTYLNGSRIQEAPLPDKAVLDLGE